MNRIHVNVKLSDMFHNKHTANQEMRTQTQTANALICFLPESHLESKPRHPQAHHT